MHKWLKILIVAVVFALVAALLVYKYVYNKAHPDYAALEADFSMPVVELFQNFRNDPVQSAKKYNGKVIALTGTLSKMEAADSLVTAVFVVSAGDFGDEGVRCTMLKQFNAEAMRLMPDGEVHLKGYCTGFTDTDVILENCSILHQ